VGAEKIPHIKRARAVALMVEGKTQTEIAREVGVSRRAVKRWAMDPKTKAMLADAADEAIAVAQQRIMSLASKSLNALEAILDDEEAGTHAKIAAADMILRRTGIDQRLAALAKQSEVVTPEEQARFNIHVDALVAERTKVELSKRGIE
jgi:predicted transcriptional regulator